MKNNQTKRLAVIITIVIVLLSITLFSCDNNFQYRVGYAENMNIENNQFDFTYVIVNGNYEKFAKKFDSLEQLSSFIEESHIHNHGENNNSCDTDFCKKVRDYDERYFVKKALITVFIFKGNYEILEFNSLEVQDDYISVSILNKTNLYSGADYDTPAIMTTYVFLIEVDKDFVKDKNKIEINEI